MISIKFSTVLFLFFFCLSIQAQWSYVTPAGIYWGTAWAIDACDSATAVICVNSNGGGLILLTTDAGKTWQNLNWPRIKTSNQIIDVSITDQFHIWGAVQVGRIIASSDGGKSWQVQFDNKNMTVFMDYIKMFSMNEGVAVGDAISDSEGSANDIFFLNEDLGWAVGKFILKTTNGGITWTEENHIKPGFLGQKIFFINPNTGWMSGDYRQGFYKTNDGGLSWDSVEVSFNNPVTYIKFFDDKNGYVLNGTSLSKTTDGGYSWNAISNSLWQSFNYVSLLSKDIGWLSYKGNVFTDPYTLVKTNDGGKTLQSVKSFPGEEIKSAYLADENTGWVITRKDSVGTYHLNIYSTTDGGTYWKVKNMGKSYISKFNFIPYLDSNGKKNYIIVGYYNANMIKKSLDNGDTWIDVSSDLSTNNVLCVNQNTWYCSTGYQRIYKTTNGGATWIKTAFEKLPPSIAHFTTTDGGRNWIRSESNLIGCSSYDTWREIDFISRDKGFFCTSPYTSSTSNIYKTLDGGSNWIKTKFSRLTQILRFYNENYGMWSAYKYFTTTQYTSFLYRTTNGGVTYDSTDIGATTVYDIEFLPGEPSKVWMSRTNGLYFSPDSGKTWISGNFGTTNASRISDIVFVNKRIGWAISNNGSSVYRTENNGGLATDVVTKETIPIKFSLSQNYPNPFNPSTVISWQIAVNSFVTLKVYDVLGREIATLVNEFQQPGIYNSTFNIQNYFLPSGVYFYTLHAGDYYETKKMVLIK